MISILIKGGNLDTETNTHKCQVKMKAKMEDASTVVRNHLVNTLLLDLASLQNYETGGNKSNNNNDVAQLVFLLQFTFYSELFTCVIFVNSYGAPMR